MIQISLSGGEPLKKLNFQSSPLVTHLISSYASTLLNGSHVFVRIHTSMQLLQILTFPFTLLW